MEDRPTNTLRNADGKPGLSATPLVVNFRPLEGRTLVQLDKPRIRLKRPDRSQTQTRLRRSA